MAEAEKNEPIGRTTARRRLDRAEDGVAQAGERAAAAGAVVERDERERRQSSIARMSRARRESLMVSSP